MLPLVPSFGFVKRNIESKLSSQEYQVRLGWVLLDGKGKAPNLGIICDSGESFSIIRTVVRIGSKVIVSVVVGDYPYFTSIERRCLYLWNPRSFWKSSKFCGYIRPSFATILCYLQVAIICTYPDDILVYRRRSNRNDGRMVFSTSDVKSQTTSFLLTLLGGIVGGQIWRNDFPGFTRIFGLMQKLRSIIHGICIVRVLCNCCIPVVS